MQQFTMAALGMFMVSSITTHGAFFETGGAVSHAGYVNVDDLQQVWSFETLVASEGTDFIIATGSSTQNSVAQSLQRTQDAEHLVKPGEDLSSIASWYNLKNVQTIMWANDLDNANIKPGMRLTIPAVDGFRYTVRKGDSIAVIANRFGVSYETISGFNSVNDKNLSIGKTIFIPDSTFTSRDLQRTLVASNQPVQVAESRVVASPVLDIPETAGPQVNAAPAPKPESAGPTVNAVEAPKNSTPANVAPTINATPAQANNLPTGVNVAPAVTPPPATGPVNGNGWFDPLNGVKARLTQGYHRGHLAVDLALRGGTGIYAAGSGTVVVSECGRNGYGCHVIIRHDNGFTTLYAHMTQKSTWNKGDRVERGAYLGWMGTTGWSTGVHLHFEIVNPQGVKISPLGSVF